MCLFVQHKKKNQQTSQIYKTLLGMSHLHFDNKKLENSIQLWKSTSSQILKWRLSILNRKCTLVKNKLFRLTESTHLISMDSIHFFLPVSHKIPVMKIYYNMNIISLLLVLRYRCYYQHHNFRSINILPINFTVRQRSVVFTPQNQE